MPGEMKSRRERCNDKAGPPQVAPEQWDRRVPGNGRVYHIGFTAEDDKGEACSAEVLVGAPHDRNTAPVDNGAIYDSTVP